ncbi:MAG TPA: branched-chain amino acid ABC transporter permease, partial [Microbacteriaceae bacterium]|nr:branched-chain amino acid ABC transporter permease [Microbacteriaceae bacterium]
MTRVSAKRLVFAAFIVVLVVLGMTLPVYWVFLLSTVAISALIARSVGLVTNQTGLVTLCQMSFAAIGGWVVSWMALTWPYLPFLLFVLVGGLVAGVMGVVIGIATVRIRGIEFAVVTLGFAAALDLVL